MSQNGENIHLKDATREYKIIQMTQLRLLNTKTGVTLFSQLTAVDHGNSSLEETIWL